MSSLFRVRRQPFVGVLLCVALIVGCGDGVTLSGAVTYDDRPVPAGRIALKPGEGKAVSTEIVDGRYQFDEGSNLQTTQQYRVRITATRETGRTYRSPDPPLVDGKPVANQPHELIKEVEQYVPPRYNRQTTLEIVLVAGENQRDFNLEK